MLESFVDPYRGNQIRLRKELKDKKQKDKEKNVYSALEELKEKGFTKVLPISFDSDLWTDLRGNWMKDEGIGFREDTEVLDTLHGR